MCSPGMGVRCPVAMSPVRTCTCSCAGKCHGQVTAMMLGTKPGSFERSLRIVELMEAGTLPRAEHD